MHGWLHHVPGLARPAYPHEIIANRLAGQVHLGDGCHRLSYIKNMWVISLLYLDSYINYLISVQSTLRVIRYCNNSLLRFFLHSLCICAMVLLCTKAERLLWLLLWSKYFVKDVTLSILMVLCMVASWRHCSTYFLLGILLLNNTKLTLRNL